MKLIRDGSTGSIIGAEVVEAKRFEAYYMNICAPKEGPVGVFNKDKGLNQTGIWFDDGHETLDNLDSYTDAIWIELTEDGANALLKYNEQHKEK